MLESINITNTSKTKLAENSQNQNKNKNKFKKMMMKVLFISQIQNLMKYQLMILQMNKIYNKLWLRLKNGDKMIKSTKKEFLIKIWIKN